MEFVNMVRGMVDSVQYDDKQGRLTFCTHEEHGEGPDRKEIQLTVHSLQVATDLHDAATKIMEALQARERRGG